MDAVEELGAVLIDSAAGSRALGSPDERHI